MLFDRLDEHFDARNLDLPQAHGQRSALVAVDAAGATIGDVPLGVERAEVGADRHVVGPEFETNAGRFQGATADHILQRIVAEQAQMPRPAAGRDARLDRNAPAQHATAGQRVEVRRLGRFQFGQTARFERQPAQPVGDEHDNLRIVPLNETARQVVHVHSGEVINAE